MTRVRGRRAVLGLIGAAAFLAAAAGSAVAGPAGGRPNIILIMADDLGYECIGANGGSSYKTPVLDGLAAGGARFTQCYAQPLCTPTRIQLMTGRYNVRNYVQFGAIDPGAVTFGTLLKQAGYATAVAGKWQLGRDPELPRKLGFEESFLWQHTRRPPRYANPGIEVNGEPKDFRNGEYGPDQVNQFARDFVTRKKDVPFFLYYPMILTHDPYQPTPDSPDWDPKAMGEMVNRAPRHFGEMVAYMDKLIGKLVAHLDSLGLRRRTLVLFLGDNGTGRRATSVLNGRPVQGGKGRTTTTGMHVPLIASWPGRVPPGQVRAELVDTTDFLPTLLDAAGVKAAVKTDGRSLLPGLTGGRALPREWVYTWYSPRQGPNASMAVRECAFNERWKLYRTGEFYDLQADTEEASALPKEGLKGEAAAAARRLQSALDRFRDARPAALDRAFQDAARPKPPAAE